MRISDWSSDVCSSDLKPRLSGEAWDAEPSTRPRRPPADRLRPPPARDAAALSSQGRGGDGIADRAFVREQWRYCGSADSRGGRDRGAARLNRSRRAGAIGTASMRERVWQAGWKLGGAVECKKKTK